MAKNSLPRKFFYLLKYAQVCDNQPIGALIEIFVKAKSKKPALKKQAKITMYYLQPQPGKPLFSRTPPAPPQQHKRTNKMGRIGPQPQIFSKILQIHPPLQQHSKSKMIKSHK